MKLTRLISETIRRSPLLLFPGLLFLTLFAFPAAAKMATDFDPNRDFLNFRTFSFIRGVEQLVRLHLNPNELNKYIHRGVTLELTGRARAHVSRSDDTDPVLLCRA